MLNLHQPDGSFGKRIYSGSHKDWSYCIVLKSSIFVICQGVRATFRLDRLLAFDEPKQLVLGHQKGDQIVRFVLLGGTHVGIQRR